MNQTDKLKARDIIQTIVKGMEEGAEPLFERAIVPAHFDVFLKQEDFDRIRPIFLQLNAETKKALDAKLDLLNKPKHKLARIFGGNEVGHYQRSLADWHIQFKLHPNDAELAEGTFEVVAIYGLPSGPDLGEDGKTIRLRNEAGSTRRMADPPLREPASATGSFVMGDRTTPANRPAAGDIHEQTGQGKAFPSGGSRSQAEGADERTRRVSPSEEKTKRDELGEIVPPLGAFLAELRYNDGKEWRLVGIRQDRFVVGRGGKDSWVDHRILLNNDISREHLIFHCDSKRGVFCVKDVSRYGTLLNGKPLPMGANMAPNEGFVDLPKEAELKLADILVLYFKSML